VHHTSPDGVVAALDELADRAPMETASGPPRVPVEALATAGPGAP
jgi:hypothetical protein